MQSGGLSEHVYCQPADGVGLCVEFRNDGTSSTPGQDGWVTLTANLTVIRVWFEPIGDES